MGENSIRKGQPCRHKRVERLNQKIKLLRSIRIGRFPLMVADTGNAPVESGL